MDGYEALAFAIVNSAVRQYWALRKKEQRYMGLYEAEQHQKQVAEMERWFVSDYGNILCLGKGEAILEKLRKEFE